MRTIEITHPEGTPMSQLGNDPAQLRALARTIEQERDALEGMFRTVGGRLSSTWWQGDDATSFRQRWEQHHHAGLQRAIRALSEAAGALERNASQQEQISRG